MTGDTHKTLRRPSAPQVQTPLPKPSTGSHQDCLLRVGAESAWLPVLGDRGICPVAPRATPPPRPPRRAAPRHGGAHPCPRLSGEVLARDAPTPEGALPVPGAAAFPDELSSPLGVLPMLGRPVPFSSWPLVLRRLPTSPHKPGPPGCARSTPSASQAGSSPRNKPGAGNVSTLRHPRRQQPEVKPRGPRKKGGGRRDRK